MDETHAITRDWLLARGWTPTDAAYMKANKITSESWCDPDLDADGVAERGWFSFENAAIRQRARDAAEARAAWVVFAASRGAALADEMLAKYQERFHLLPQV